MPIKFPSFCDHFFVFKAIVDYVYVHSFQNQSRIEKGWGKNIQNKDDRVNSRSKIGV